MQELIDKLQLKVKSYKHQAEEAVSCIVIIIVHFVFIPPPKFYYIAFFYLFMIFPKILEFSKMGPFCLKKCPNISNTGNYNWNEYHCTEIQFHPSHLKIYDTL